MGRFADNAVIGIFVLAGLGMSWLAYREHLLLGASTPSSCRVVATTVSYNQHDSRNPYKPVVTIEHEVAGKKWRRDSEGLATRNNADADARARRFVVGSSVPCKYPADHPDLVTVFEASASNATGFAVLAFVFLVPMPIVAFFVMRRRRMPDGIPT